MAPKGINAGNMDGGVVVGIEVKRMIQRQRLRGSLVNSKVGIILDIGPDTVAMGLV